VTVLFCDLVGSTALGDSADPEVLQELMQRYHAELRQLLERHGGTVEKFVGDAAMAVFGIPQAHEDDALRAVRAAAEMRETVAALELEVRIGINTGEVVAGAGETLVTGDAVNVAARLEQASPAGEILLGERTARLVGDAVSAEPVEPLPLKGKGEPVPAFRLLELLPDVPAFTRPIETPFVGRDEELASLQHALIVAVEQRQPQLASILGPPGIGKSRLVRELAQRAEARVLVGRCLSYGEGITYWPLAEVVRQLGEIASVVDDELVVRRVDAALSGGEATADEIALAFRKLFETVARERPLVIVLEDIHWAEPTLLDLIEYLATFAADAPLLVLCSARPDLFERRPAWVTPKPNRIAVTLEPLAEEHAQTLVEELGELPQEARQRIVEAAEGNPLFVEQLVAHQAESGNGTLEIPATIQALLAARIDRLEPLERAVIERASVEGRLFHRGSVQALLPDTDRAAVGSHLLTLVRKEFVRPDRAEVPDDDGFRFGHILIRDAAYDSIPKRLRAELHERFAGWFESKLGEAAPPEILGYHLEQAYRYRVELGQEDGHARELARRAGRLLGTAGWRADARGDAASTVCSLLVRATDLLPGGDDERPRLLALLGEATVNAGDPLRAIEILRDAQAAAASGAQRGIELRARMRELWAVLYTNPPDDTEPLLAEAREAVDELEDLGDPELLADAWMAISQVAALQGDMALCGEASEQRLVNARRAGRVRQTVWAANWVVNAFAEGATPVEEAIRRAEQVRAEFPDERPGEGPLGLLLAFAGRDAEAEQAIGRYRSTALERGQRTYYAGAAEAVGLIALLAGKPERAEDALREGVGILDAAGDSVRMAGVGAVLAEVLYRTGREAEAEEWTRRAEQSGSVEVRMQAAWRSTRAKLMARRGEEQADQLAADAVEWASRTDNLALLADCLAARAETLQLLGRPDEARRVYEEALAVYKRKGVVRSIERTRKALAELEPVA
jgi:class 3 adenylate cyclase/tetratricopeptide (TPR) repeat protein